MYFQAKGTHDHPKPEPKGSNQTKQLYSKRKSNAVDLLKRKSAVNTKIRSLRLNATTPKKPSLSVVGDSLNFVFPGECGAKDNYGVGLIATEQQWSPDYEPYNDRVPGYSSSHQYNTPISYGSNSPASSYAQQSPHQQHSPQSATSDIFNCNTAADFIRPEDIFQLDQPIRHHHQSNSYAGSTYSNGMSPSSASRSPPATFLDLESGTIAPTFNQYPTTNFNSSSAQKNWTANSCVKYESCDDTTSSLTSISQEFDETYLAFQQMHQPSSCPTIVDATSSIVDQSTYFPAQSDYQFFNHCESVATGNSNGHQSAQSDAATLFYATSGFDGDYEMLNNTTAAPSFEHPMLSNEWSVDMNVFASAADAPYSSSSSSSGINYQYQQLNYLTA